MSPARRLKQEPRDPVALPHLFHRNGYTTVCLGKVSHEPGGVIDEEQKVHEVPFAWDRARTAVGLWKTPWHAFFAYENGQYYNRVLPQANDSQPRLPYQRPESPDSGFPDTLNADEAITELGILSKAGKPFFLAVGFYKPHLPFVAPQRYWDQYQADSIPSATYPKPPAHTDPSISLHKSYEPTTHYHWPAGSGKVPQAGHTLKHGYWAAVSYIDEQIGRVLDECKRLGLADDTIVVLWSDHGWHLGDHGIWGKATLHEWALRCPLIIRVPGQPQPGKPALGLVESVDLYPTLAELCGLEIPSGLQGRSQAAMVENPDAPGKDYAIAKYKNGSTIRTETHRYTEWRDNDGTIIQQELYNHVRDPLETVNRAAEEPQLTKSLARKLTDSFSKINP